MEARLAWDGEQVSGWGSVKVTNRPRAFRFKQERGCFHLDVADVKSEENSSVS